MAKPKSFLRSIEMDVAKHSHNCIILNIEFVQEMFGLN